MQADAGAQPMLQGQQLDDSWCGQLLLGAQQGAQQELVRLRIERGKTEKRMLHRSHLGGRRSGCCWSGGRFGFWFDLRRRRLRKQRRAHRLVAEQPTHGWLLLWRGGRRLGE